MHVFMNTCNTVFLLLCFELSLLNFANQIQNWTMLPFAREHSEASKIFYNGRIYIYSVLVNCPIDSVTN